ncbi:MAG: polysaccharide biosynthesis/export family protein [Phycisphaerales bacterium]|nr:polysaccharide biosynthesis/export family protein [Phycisphaerales bacterium]
MIIRNQPQLRHLLDRLYCCMGLIGVLLFSVGCEVDNYMDPSKTGYFEFAPTTIPVLERLDVVEVEELPFGEITEPNAEDLIPSSLQYRLAPGDVVKAEIYELVAAGQMDISIRVVDQAGQIRLPTLGNLPAAGLSLEELQKEIEDRLRGLITDPLVTVALESGRSFQFTIYGAVEGTGMYSLDRPDFRVMNALALAGGTIPSTQYVYVIRELALNEMVKPDFNRNRPDDDASSTSETKPKSDDEIEALIKQLESNEGSTDSSSVSPGVVAGQDPPVVDLDDVESDPRAPTTTSASKPAASEEPSQATPERSAISGKGFRYDDEKRVWVPVGGGQQEEEMLLPIAGTDGKSPSYATRIIQIDYQRLARGDSNLNVVIRPADRIYVAPPLTGVVYVDGEIARPGVYALPTSGKLTLSRLISAAGGLGPIAIPERVDMVRVVASDREAAVRVNLSAIRNRAEPDIYMQPDDHVIIGTNFWAQPLAVVRNGFRASYGFGFLLDRNFGNDVFGAPPVNYVGPN